jgi:hypothetical protein
LIKTDNAAVQVVGNSAVLSKLVGNTVERKTAVCDPVSVASDKRTLISAAVKIVFDSVESADYISEYSITVRYIYLL